MHLKNFHKENLDINKPLDLDVIDNENQCIVIDKFILILIRQRLKN